MSVPEKKKMSLRQICSCSSTAVKCVVEFKAFLFDLVNSLRLMKL